MPYVEGFGTWPFGEEWLWEAIATCYLPLLDVLERAPITLSLTPVLCDQLEAPGRDRALPRVPARDQTRDRTAATTPRFRRGRPGPGCGEIERSAASTRPPRSQLDALGRTGCWRALGQPRELDLGRDARDAAAARHRRRRSRSRSRPARVAPPALRRLGGWILAARVRARAVARLAARGGGRPRARASS